MAAFGLIFVGEREKLSSSITSVSCVDEYTWSLTFVIISLSSLLLLDRQFIIEATKSIIKKPEHTSIPHKPTFAAVPSVVSVIGNRSGSW